MFLFIIVRVEHLLVSILKVFRKFLELVLEIKTIFLFTVADKLRRLFSILTLIYCATATATCKELTRFIKVIKH